MTKQSSFKDRIRARMEKTGETYATARRQLIERSETEALKRRTPKTISPVRSSDEAIETNTGRSYDNWFKRLDKWGAREAKHGEIARWLVEEHGIDGWWAQHVTVAYEQDLGIRAPGQGADGYYTANASKTVNVPKEALFEAFMDEETRHSWLGTFGFDIRTTRPAKSMTAKWEDGSTRLTISFEPKGDDRSVVALAHQKIADAQQVDELKLFWRERLNLLKKLLEG